MKEGGGALKTATAIVGLVAGLAGTVYVLGGLVIALRLLFDHFSLTGAVTAVGQLPRETVIATALLGVFGLAGLFGLAIAMVYGFAGRPRPRRTEAPSERPSGITVLEHRHEVERAERAADRLDAGPKLRVAGLFAFFLLFSVAAIYLAWHEANAADDGRPRWEPFAFALLLTGGAVAAGWYAIRRVGRKDGWMRFEKSLAVGGIWAAIAVIPAVMLAGTKPFETAQLCVTGEALPVEGRLIGEGSDKLFLEEEFGREAAIVAIPADQVSKREIGDLSSTFVCPLEPGQVAAAKVAEEEIGPHGLEQERRIAQTLRPLLRFDSGEDWRPLEVGAFLAERAKGGRGHLACAAEEGSTGARGWVRCGEPALGMLTPGLGAPEFIEIDGELRRPDSYRSPRPDCEPRRALDCKEGRGSVIYYRRTSHEGRWYWDYWWFFRFNDYTGSHNECRFYCADHEGDWEGMTVVTTASVADPVIVGAIYAAHKDRVYVPGELVPRRGNHALVYVARGTHASYPFPCRAGKCDQYGALIGFRLPEEGHDGVVAWKGNLDSKCRANGCVRPLPDVRQSLQSALPLATGWAAWPGKWGSSCVAGCSRAESSPSSPGLQTRFRCPWAPTREARLAPDGTVSRSDPAGDAERLLALCKAQRGGF